MKRAIFILMAISGLLIIPLVGLSARALQQGSGNVAAQEGGLTLTSPETGEDLGRWLFFDPRISGDGLVSCASCHVTDQAWTDGAELSAGYTGTLYFRNTPTLLNSSQMPVFDWDGRFASGDMTSLVRDHLVEAHFMNMDGRLLIERLRQVPEYEQGFNEVYGGDPSFGRALSALAAFVGTLNSENHPYQRHLDGEQTALSAEALEGLAIFEGKGNCSQCHSGPLLSDGDFHALGVPENADIYQNPLRHITFRRFLRGFGVNDYANLRQDIGLGALTLEPTDRGKFRTPSLLEVSRTAPYMHNGTLGSLDEVVGFYDAGGGEGLNRDSRLQPLGLSERERDSLVVFLRSLGSEESAFEAPLLPAYQPRALGDN